MNEGACENLGGAGWVPLIAPMEARVYDMAVAAAAVGCRLVADGGRIYLVPAVPARVPA